MKRAIITIASGDHFEQMSATTHPTLKAYADRIGADFIVWNDCSGHTVPQYKKMEMGALLDQYSRVMYIDTDILVREDAPDLFDIVPEDQIGLFEEGRYAPRRGGMIQFMVFVGYDITRWNGCYYNTGVMVFSAQHRDIFVQPTAEWDHFKEQTYLNVMISDKNVKVFPLAHRFNRMCIMDQVLGEARHDCFFLHYAGLSFQMSDADLRQLVKDDLAVWQNSRPAYQFAKRIAFVVLGGLGDQVAAEPTIRYARDHMYAGDELVIVSPRPEIFRHLHLPVFAESSEIPNLRYFRSCFTQPDESTELLRRVDRNHVHPVDLCSLLALDIELTQSDKTPRLVAGTAALVAVGEKTRPHDLEKLVLLHPGRGAPAKTFPADVWQSYADVLVDHGYTVAVIGKRIDAGQGIVEFDRSRCVDLVDRLSVAELIALVSRAKVLVSNDSAPVQIAGAFDRWIGLIATSRHPDYVLPWRKGSQTWRAGSLERAPLYNDYRRQVSLLGSPGPDTCGETRLRECLSEPSAILAFVNRAFADREA